MHRHDGYTAEQFVRDYAARAGWAPAQVSEFRQVVRCGLPDALVCDDPECQGWAMVPIGETNARGLPRFDHRA